MAGASLIARTPNGIQVWTFHTATLHRLPLTSGAPSFWGDNQGFAQQASYLTIRAADVNGDGQAELLGQTNSGLQTWGFDPATNTWSMLSEASPPWAWNPSDSPNDTTWSTACYYSTIVVGDIDADRRAELLGRDTQGMETWFFNSPMGLWQQPTPRLSVDARFMENYVQGAPVTTDGPMVTAVNAAGQVEIFTLGARGQVYNLYPDTNSDTGWSAVSLGVSATQIAAGRTQNGTLVLFAAQADPGPTPPACSTSSPLDRAAHSFTTIRPAPVRRSPFSAASLHDVYAMHALADYFFGAASACADAVPPQKPGTHSEEPTAWEFLASLGTLATEMIVWFTSCPLWALSPANAPAWAGWAVAASAPAADIAWFRASLKIGQLNQDKGVCVTVAVAIFNLIVGVAVAAFQKDRALLIPSAILGALPGGFKWLRLWAVYEQNPLATLGSLCAIDLIGQTASGGIAMYVNDQALNSAGQTVPA